MKISVVTISYNQATFLRECIESVLSQNYTDLEYIVVDPGSTDGSRQIIESYGDRITKVFEKDAGAADGLNKGFAKASGDVFCYLNSDDVFLPNSFQYVAEEFEKHKFDVMCGHGYVIDSQSKFLRKVYSDCFNLTAVAYGSSIAIQPSTFFTREAYQRSGGFNVSNRSNWDGELLVAMSMSGSKIQTVKRFLSCYRVHSQSITGTGRLNDLHHIHSKKMFEKIMGRDYSGADLPLRLYYRFRKHILNPRAALERIVKGRVFGVAK